MSQHVLVVEDNALNLELVTDLLEANGYVVHAARTAEEAFHLAQQTPPDLVLMDISLPGLDGLAATRALRANPRTRHLAIVALTAHAMRGDEELALNAGCEGYLSKPIDTRTFIQRIATFIAAARSRLPESETFYSYANCNAEPHAPLRRTLSALPRPGADCR